MFYQDCNSLEIKFSFFILVQSLLDGKGSTFILASGPLAEIEAVFPRGSFLIAAEIHEEAGAFTEFILMDHIDILLPEQDEYEQFDIEEHLRVSKVNGNQNRVAQILQADVNNF